MNKILLTSLTLSLLVFAGCQMPASQPVTPTQEETQSQETRESGLKIEMIYPDGTTQQVSDFNKEPVKEELISEGSKVSSGMGKGMVMTKDGFAPKALTMKVGETLLIQNVDEAKHWPASDPHPVHTDHPEFDAAYPMAKDDVYDFVFDKPGVYGLHDHMNPQFTATITVVE